MKRSTSAIVLVLVALCSSALGAGYYGWFWNGRDSAYASNFYLTENNGSHAVALGWTGSDYWTCVAADHTTDGARDSMCAFEWYGTSRKDQTGDFHWPYAIWKDESGVDEPGNGSVAANSSSKLWMCSDFGTSNHCRGATKDLTYQGAEHYNNFTGDDKNPEKAHAGLCISTGTRMVAAYSYLHKWNQDYTYGLHDRFTTNRQTWSDPPTQIVPDGSTSGYNHPSLASNGSYTYVAYKDPDEAIVFKRSTNWGESWGGTVTLSTSEGERPCIAAVDQFVFACWYDFASYRVVYRLSTDYGSNWEDERSINGLALGSYTHANVVAVKCDGKPGVLFTCAFSRNGKRLAYTRFGLLVTDYIAWRANVLVSRIHTSDQYLRPSVAVALDGQGRYSGLCVYGATMSTGNQGFHLLRGYAAQIPGGGGPNTLLAGTGRLIAKGPDGTLQYAAASPPHVVWGPADADLFRILVAPGSQPALALDGDGEQWIAYTCDDTVWVRTGEDSYEVAFAGSSSAVPGQPSIVCYPNQANGVYVGNVVFPVYDTAGSASRIMYARVDTGGVVLDTIESVNTLRDSLPCISVYKGDTLVCTYQHGDSVLSRLLADYGPSTQGQPPAWSSVNLVTASGYHAMSVMENGSVLNCAYTAKSGSDYSIQRSTNDLGGGMFSNWVAMTAPSAGSNVEKSNPVYSGVGCSVWQQKDANGKWIIKGYVRGEETTLVANDTDAYSPHAVAESSASSPSVDRIRVHLLYTAGVTFEVDSAAYDTGETRYSAFDFDVSNAGSDATRANNGSKLMRKEGGDSLYAAYQDADGTVMYAYSAAGDSWRREVLATERSYPAIASDSTGKRWVVARTADGSLPAAQYLYYQSGGSWASQSLYSGMNLLGPASLAGASSTTTGFAYAAFKVTGMFSQYIVLSKYNGSAVAACTVATGANLGDPSVAVEAYKTDSDHVHVTWEDAGVVKYRMDTDGRSSGIANNWTAVVSLSDVQATSHHPVINADRDQIVAAWAQGATADIYYRKRSTASAYDAWDNAVNLSNTANDASDWPTVAMGDTVVVAWEETRSAYDHDILVCVDFGDTMSVADNATVSGYPHVIFQNKVSGDTCIPYLLSVWSEEPSASYYEVGYNKLNLKQSSGEGQQSASSTPIPTKPSLAACRPNPFRDRTQINYALPTGGNVSLRVYDATGRTVRTLASGHQKAGSYSVTWDSRDNRGRQVPRGVYFYRLDTPGFRSVKKAVVAR